MRPTPSRKGDTYNPGRTHAATKAPTALPSFMRPDDTLERLQNLLAKRGVASRRGAADLILAGKVTVNGHVITEPGARFSATDDICVNGEALSHDAEETHTYLYHKPVGEVCSTDGQGARSVLEAFHRLPWRLVPVGRLDKESEGLLLISNDGELIHRMTHPRYGHRKVYDVDVDTSPDEKQLGLLRSPLTIEGYRIRPVPVTPLGETTLRFVLSEGRHRQIREMCKLVGLKVLRLKRIAIDNLQLDTLPSGKYRELTPQERTKLIKQ